MNATRKQEIASCSIYRCYGRAESLHDKLALLWDHVGDCCFCHPNRFYCDEFLAAYDAYLEQEYADHEATLGATGRCETRRSLLQLDQNRLADVFRELTDFPSGECCQCLLEHPSALARCDGYITMVRAFWDSIPEKEIQLVRLLTKHSLRPPAPGLRFMNLQEVAALAGAELSVFDDELSQLMERLVERGIVERTTDAVRVKT